MRGHWGGSRGTASLTRRLRPSDNALVTDAPSPPAPPPSDYAEGPRGEGSVPAQASGQVWVDLGCGKRKQPGSIGLDIASIRGSVDVAGDVMRTPFRDS